MSRKGSLPGDDAYKVMLKKAHGKLGFTYRALDESGGLMVTGIFPASPVDAWNETADVDKVICVGDFITAVNGVSCGGKAMVDELQSQQSVTLVLLKTGPRWHVLGATAECMDKLNDARDHGVKLEPLQPAAPDEEIREQELPVVSTMQFLMIAVAVVLPNVAVTAFFSDMGMGIKVFNFFAPKSMNFYGNAIVCCATMFSVGLYIVDWLKWKNKFQRVGTALVAIYAIATAGFMKSLLYPAAPLVICLFHLPIFLGMLRSTSLKTVKRPSFYISVFACTFVVGVAIIVAWLCWINIEAWDGINQYNDASKSNLIEQSQTMYDEQKVAINGRARSLVYNWDCHERDAQPNDLNIDARGNIFASEHVLTMAEVNNRAKACQRVKTVWFLCWMAPFVATTTNLVIAAFCLMNGVWLEIADTSKVEKALKHFVLLIFCVMLMMWISVSVAGASMRLTSTLLAFSAAGLLALFIWVYLEIGEKALSKALKNSKTVVTLITLITSDWCRAIFVICLNVMIPAMFMIEVVKQKVRKLRKTNATDALFTDEAYKALLHLLNWRWANIFIKVNWLCILYWTMSIGVAKITVVFLSWLNEELGQWSFGMVLFVFFWIGFTMFMLPPVPGIPVYITSGIIIAKQGSYIPSIGFYGGTVIAILLSFILKLAACTGQYMIGYYMGKSVKVQQMVGVDKVFTRGIESILQVRGFSAGKVAVLVGGPDWPTSVLCGILGLNIPQVLLGTMPVIFVSSPCVLAGAFMAGPSDNMSDGEESMWSALANTALIVSTLVQLTSGILALYYIQEVIRKHEEELGKPRAEHARVAQLTLDEKDYNQAYAEVTEWRTLPRLWKGVILLSSTVMLGACFVLTFMDELCFKPFEVKYRVSAPESENGLGAAGFGEALQSIILFWGELATASFLVGVALHFTFLKYASAQAQKHLALKPELQALNNPSPDDSALHDAAVAATAISVMDAATPS